MTLTWIPKEKVRDSIKLQHIPLKNNPTILIRTINSLLSINPYVSKLFKFNNLPI